jgi:hypothetical protein
MTVVADGDFDSASVASALKLNLPTATASGQRHIAQVLWAQGSQLTQRTGVRAGLRVSAPHSSASEGCAGVAENNIHRQIVAMLVELNARPRLHPP